LADLLDDIDQPDEAIMLLSGRRPRNDGGRLTRNLASLPAAAWANAPPRSRLRRE
jgi:hypothetical protein